MQRFKHLFEVNEKHGSFYLVSKVVRAKEALEVEYEADGRKTPEAEDPAKAQQQLQGKEAEQKKQ